MAARRDQLLKSGAIFGVGQTLQQGLFGGGFRAKRGVAKRNAAKLRKEATEDRTISDETRTEIISGLDSPDLFTNFNLRRLRGRFDKARSGIGQIFRSRQVLQEQRNILKDRPGRRQTLLGSFSGRGTSGTIGGGA